MTAYDTINKIDKETRKSLVRAGFLSITTERNISIFERYNNYVEKGKGRMEAKIVVAREFKVSSKTVELVCRKMTL